MLRSNALFSGLISIRNYATRGTNTTPPRVYPKIKQILLEKNTPVTSEMTEDHANAITVARSALLQPTPRLKNRSLTVRLRADGGQKLLKLNRAFVHTEYTRFIEPCGQIKGLTLNEALLQLDWNKKMITKKMKDAIDEFIIRAKEEGFDLDKTYIAEAYVKGHAPGLSKTFQKKYLFGRGRYGATPHPKIATIEFILQERQVPFAIRKSDPLEWVRSRLRERKKDFVLTADQIYQKKRLERPVKTVYC
ncbi:hypothetical protein BC833DRAFT_611438 [Globomyces pollinis-pini]|nr:hypothetical protein BC833DRAFT_611438 [Globomyces pollinis-pini]